MSWHQYVTNGSDGKNAQQIVTDSMGVQNDAQTIRAAMRAAGIDDSVPLFLGEYNVNGAVYTDPNNENMVGAIAAAATTYGMIHSNTNMTMGALWDVMNDSAYSVFGASGNFRVDSVGITLGDLTSYMPGNLVQTTMPGDTPGLVGYTTTDNGLFSTALINTNLSTSYTVDLSKDGLPATGLYRIEVSPGNPQGSKTAITDLSHVAIAAGSLVIISDETPHGGTELNGTTSNAPLPKPVPPSTPTPTPTPVPMAPPAATPAPTPASPPTSALPPTQAPAPVPTPPVSTSPAVAAPPSNPTPTPVPAPPASVPAPAPPSTPAPVAAPPTVGTGPDTVVLTLSEDAFRGDGQFVLTVDGKQVGPAQSVTALHSQGQTESFTLKGDFGAGPHQFGVSFVNDLWDGAPVADRNLYLDSATFNGAEVMNAVALRTNGTVPFGTAPIKPPSQAGGTGQAGTDPTSPAPFAIAPSPTVGTGPDSVTLNLSEDAYRGDAQFVLTVDGKPAGPAQSVTALHGQGQTEAFTFKDDWGAGAHEFGISFTNDLWDGTSALDRNLYVDSATYNGGLIANTVALLADNTARFGSAAFAKPSAPAVVPGTGGPMIPPKPSVPGQAVPGVVLPIVSTTAPAAVPPSIPTPSNALPHNLVPGVPTPSYPGQGGPGVPPAVGTGPDSVTLDLSEDADAGDAQFVFTVDGQQVGPTQSVTALHGKDPSEEFAFRGDWGSGTHQFGIAFVNRVQDGSAGANRHLYLDSAAFDTNLVADATEVLSGTPVTFGMAAIGGPPGQPIGMSAPAASSSTAASPASQAAIPSMEGAAPIVDTKPVSFALTPPTPSATAPSMLTVTDNSGVSTAVPLIASGSQTDTPSPASTVTQTVSNGADTITSSGSVKGESLTLGAGEQKMILVNPRAMVLTGGSGIDTVSADNGANTYVAGSGSLTVTGGPGATAYLLHAASGQLAVNDFDFGKGDTLTIDKSLQPALEQASDGQGGTLLSFGAGQSSVDLIHHASVNLSDLRFI